MTPFHIREVRPLDLEGIAQMERSSSFSPGWTLRQFEEEMGLERSCFLIAEDKGPDGESSGGGAVGFIVWRLRAPEAELLDVGVDPDFRHQGIGAQLLREGTEVLRVRGARKFLLEVHEKNRAALRLYESAGFRVVGSRRGFYNGLGRKGSALLMELSA